MCTHAQASTSAWNLCIEGRKRWAFYPPGLPPPGVTLMPGTGSAEYVAPPAARWFEEVRPTLTHTRRPRYELVQQEGEIVFVPAGWWHCVLNLEPTVAFTANVITDGNVEACIEAFGRVGDVETTELLRTLAKSSQEDKVGHSS